jgi:hypothetical protein
MLWYAKLIDLNKHHYKEGVYKGRDGCKHAIFFGKTDICKKSKH